MIRPNIEIGDIYDADFSRVYPPLQWNDCASTRKMVTDAQVWLHNHYPEWKEATLNLMHFNEKGTHSFTSCIPLERGAAR